MKILHCHQKSHSRRDGISYKGARLHHVVPIKMCFPCAGRRNGEGQGQGGSGRKRNDREVLVGEEGSPFLWT